eukprot:4947397-Pleurochrysis_carterae.AAC.1
MCEYIDFTSYPQWSRQRDLARFKEAEGVLAFCADVSKVDDILELVRVLTVAARKSKAPDRKRSRGYREFNVSARNDDQE